MVSKCGRLSKMTKDDLLAVVIECESYSDVLRKIGLKIKGQAIAIARTVIERHGISTDHFLSRSEQMHRDGSPFEGPLPIELVLIENSPYPTARARFAFKRLGFVPYQCVECGQEPMWRGKSLVLVFDHRDGDSRNHKPSNLRWLCPNCNSQTDTFCGRNKSNPKRRRHSERNHIRV